MKNDSGPDDSIMQLAKPDRVVFCGFSTRDTLIEALERRLHQHSRSHRLFRIRWKLV